MNTNERTEVLLTGEEDVIRKIIARPELRDLRAALHSLPTVSFRARELSDAERRALVELSQYDYLFFSSARAVRYFADVLREADVDPGSAPPAVVVGPMTARACADAGFAVTSMPATFTAADMVREFASLTGSRILFPRSNIAPEDTVTSITNSGADVTEVSLYETVGRSDPLTDPERAALAHARYIVFLSPSSVRGFVKRMENSTLQQTQQAVTALCIGPRTARIAQEHDFHTITAAKYTVDGVIETLKDAYST